MSSNPSLWWSYDPENRSFGALPPGPLLVPAIGILAFVSIIQAIRSRPSQESTLSRSFVNASLYQSSKKRHDYLVDKKIDAAMGIGDGLSVSEAEELRQLKRPVWNEGEPWSY